MYVSVADFPVLKQNSALTHCSMLTLNMILTKNKNMIHFKQRLLLNWLSHDLEIIPMNGGESISQYHTPLIVAKFTGKLKKIKSGYFIATPHTSDNQLNDKHNIFPNITFDPSLKMTTTN
jgi:hypothetical protein